MQINPFLPESLFILDSEELELVQSNNPEKNRLAFAVMLKFFQTNGRYPIKKDTIDPMIISSLAAQLKISPVLFEPIYLGTRVSERFRRKIRGFLGYRIAKLSDAETLIIWLIEQMQHGSYTMPQYREKAHEFFKENKLEPFTHEKTDRYIRSAIHQQISLSFHFQ
jgi:hypothetical protein